MRGAILMLPALALLASCGDGGEGNEGNNTIIVENDTIIVPDANLSAGEAAGNGQEADGSAKLNVAPDGLSLIVPTGSARHLPFGAPRETTLQAIGAALGQPMEQGDQQECGSGTLAFAHFRGGLSLYFQEGRFVGWDLDGQDSGNFTTAAGVGIGSSRAQLEEVVSIEVEETTLGVEFRSGAMSGLLSGREPMAQITNLWAGATCLVR